MDHTDKPYQNLNSWTDTWVRLGSIGFIIFMWWYFNSLRKYAIFTLNSGKGWVILYGSVIISLTAQPILFTTVFAAFIYIGYYKSPVEVISINSSKLKQQTDANQIIKMENKYC
jgi:hypothetical protein